MSSQADVKVFGGYFPFATTFSLDVPTLFNQFGLDKIWEASYKAVGDGEVTWLGAGAWDPCHFTTKEEITSLDQLKGMLMAPVDVMVGVLSKDTVKVGATTSKANIVGDEVFIFHGSTSPTLYDASFAKTFRTTRGGVDSVKQYREESANSDILAINWSEDIQVVSTTCARRLTIS